ncbi:MAG: hypothetical protein J7647_02730 [Cyanobacteria bacterium SBLK]|nr:hypothetical protein [Cyanobacteria bacterium SBLK]
MKTAQKLKHASTPPKVLKSRPRQSRANPARLQPARLQSKHRNHAATAVETLVKIALNCGLSAVAIATLTNLFPYYWEQREKVQAIRTEVRDAEYKVTRLRANLNRSFDPSQALNVMQEQSAMVAPNQRRIVLMDETE